MERDCWTSKAAHYRISLYAWTVREKLVKSRSRTPLFTNISKCKDKEQFRPTWGTQGSNYEIGWHCGTVGWVSYFWDSHFCLLPCIQILFLILGLLSRWINRLDRCLSQRPQLVKGNMQLFSVDQQRSQALEAHAASFATFKVVRCSMLFMISEVFRLNTVVESCVGSECCPLLTTSRSQEMTLPQYLYRLPRRPLSTANWPQSFMS